jgi:mannose-6-phosphate isomerase-like protein (cupin superfamily)
VLVEVNPEPEKNMKKTASEAIVRRIDDSLTIIDLFNGKDFPFDFVIATLMGNHPKVVNRVSHRAYFFLEGSGVVSVGDKEYAVHPNDLVLIPAKTPHGLRGNLKYAIITSPPFDPKNETTAER